MKWQNVRRRKPKKKKGRKAEKLKPDALLGLVERESFETLADIIVRRGLKDRIQTVSNAHHDPLPMHVFRKYVFDEMDKPTEERLLDDIELFFKALFIRPEFTPNDTCNDGESLLHLLCKAPRATAVLKALLERDDVDINLVDKFDCTPLDICTLYKNEEARQLLLGKGGKTSQDVAKIDKEKKESTPPYASLEEYREMKVNNFYPKTANLKRLLDPNVLDKKWI